VIDCAAFVAVICLYFALQAEGASGFGTTLAAPMLVSFGYDPLQSVVVLLVFNMAPAVFGAIGTPIWLGLDSFDEAVLKETAQRAAIVLAVCTLIVIPWVLTVIAPRQVVLQNLGFIYLSLLSSIGPAVAIAFFSYEFPSLLGGMIGCIVTSILIKYKVLLKPMGSDAADDREWGSLSEHSLVQNYLKSRSNLSDRTEGRPRLEVVEEGDEEEEQTQSDREITFNSEGTRPECPRSTTHSNAEPDRDDSEAFSEHQSNAFMGHIDDHLGARKTWSEGYVTDLVLRTFPIWGVVLLLVCTRLPQLGLKELLQQGEPSFAIHFGTLGIFRMSGSLVIQLQNILTNPNLNWRYEALYVPFILPFVIVSALTMWIFRKGLSAHPREVPRAVAKRLVDPAIAFFGAFALVQLMIRSGEQSPAFIIGSILSRWFQEGFVVISPLLGCLGTSVSGTGLVSNLTFGQVQAIAADSIGIAPSILLALQVVGGSAGNGVSCTFSNGVYISVYVSSVRLLTCSCSCQWPVLSLSTRSSDSRSEKAQSLCRRPVMYSP
jgi:L-lactate permease